jgi:hypothetical protein
VEADISRLKRVIGDALRSRADRRRATEGSIAVKALNRMLELGRPEYVRLVRHTMASGPPVSVRRSMQQSRYLSIMNLYFIFYMVRCYGGYCFFTWGSKQTS